MSADFTVAIVEIFEPPTEASEDTRAASRWVRPSMNTKRRTAA